MKKQQSKKKKKLFLALIMILFTGLILTASTYAWFTANTTVTVEAIDVNVSTSEGLQISTDATNWKSIITNEDIKSATWTGAYTQLPNGSGVTSSPVSTVGNIDSDGLMEMYLGKIESTAVAGQSYNILTATKDTEKSGLSTTGNFVAFDLFFQSTKSQTIYLTSNSNVTASGTSTGIENAARVALIKAGSVAYGSSAADAQALKATSSSTKLIWEPNYDVHTASGISNALDVYNITTNSTGASKIAYSGVKSEIVKGNDIKLNSTDSTYFGSVTTTESPSSGIPESAYMSVFDVDEGITKVRVYMWVEGQDVDCEDKASGGSISYNLQFSINSEA